MEINAVLAVGATLVSLAAALCIFERWLQRPQHQLASWGVSLTLFCGASGVLWAGAAVGWNESLFRAFYLIGGVLNVLFLGLGSVYLIASERIGRKTLWATLLFSSLCIGVLWATPAKMIVDPEELPQGSDVFGTLPRILVALASSLGALAVFGIALFSLWRYLRNWNTENKKATKAQKKSYFQVLRAHYVWGVGLIAFGTLVLSLGGLFNSLGDEMSVFAATVLIGVCALFGGFLLLDKPKASHAVESSAAEDSSLADSPLADFPLTGSSLTDSSLTDSSLTDQEKKLN